MKICLSIESAGHRLGVALSHTDQVIARNLTDRPYSAPGLLLPLIREILEQASLKPEDIGSIAVNVGPGSFTGLRAGIAAAQGLAFGLSCPLIGISAFQALAKSAQRRGEAFPLSLLIDSRRNEPFAAILDENCLFIEEPRFLPRDGLETWRAMQKNLLADHPSLAVSWRPVDPFDLALLAMEKKYRLPAQPVYIREPETTKARQK